MLFISFIFVILNISMLLPTSSNHVIPRLYILDFHVLFKLMTVHVVFIYQVLLVCYTSFKIVHRENYNLNSWSWDIFAALNIMLESEGSTQIISWATYGTIYVMHSENKLSTYFEVRKCRVHSVHWENLLSIPWVKKFVLS